MPFNFNLQFRHKSIEENKEQQQQLKQEEEVSNDNGNVVTLPYYGGAKGQVLQIIHNPDGTVTTSIIKKENSIEMPQKSPLERIQQAASRLVSIQESAKRRGQFSADDSKFYADNLYHLGVAAQELASTQQNGNQLKKLFEISPTANMHTIDALESNSTKSVYHFDPVKEPDTVIQNDDDDAVQVNAPKKDASVAEAKPVGN